GRPPAIRKRHRRGGDRRLGPPGPADQLDAAHTLDRDHEINRAEDRPPAFARMIHPVEALEPVIGHERWPPAAEMTGLHLETQEAQPVAQPPVADEFALGWQEQFAESELAIHVRAP